MIIKSQARALPNVLVLPALSNANKFKPLLAKIFAAQGVTNASPARARARAIVGWIAQNAVHPQPYLHPDGTLLNTSVLPAGQTWATFNATFGPDARTNSDSAFWYTLFPNGIAMLEALVGTTDANGAITDNGMLTEYAPNKWRIRSFPSFRSVLCTHQCKMAQVLLAASGIHSVDISTTGHDPMAYYDPDQREWLYIDPTYGEMFSLNGKDCSPLDLLMASRALDMAGLVDDGLPGAEFLARSYFTDPVHPQGMTLMTIHTSPQWAGGVPSREPYHFGDLPGQSLTFERRGTRAKIAPELGCGIMSARDNSIEVEVRLRSNWPNHSAFQRSLDAGNTWQACTDIDYVSTGVGGVLYRSIDATGASGTIASVTI